MSKELSLSPFRNINSGLGPPIRTAVQQRTFLMLPFLLWTLSMPANVRQIFTPLLYERVKTQYGEQGVVRVGNWQHLLEQQTGGDNQATLDMVNRFFNQRPFIDDVSHWQKNDYWATPIEFLGSDGGDCEDFAIAKYFTLQAFGVPVEKMRLMYVKAIRLNQAHMVLAYYPTRQQTPLILDNLNPDILPATERPDLRPVYSFNGSGLWLAKARGLGQTVQHNNQLSLWQSLTQRMGQMSKQGATP